MALSNSDISRIFNELADLLEIDGADGFRVNAHRKVARAIDDLSEALSAIHERGALSDVPGVGKSSAEKIAELLDTGTLQAREDVARRVPESLLELLRIQNVGPKKVAVLYHELGIQNIAGLKEAIADQRLDALKGFGKKSIEAIERGLQFVEESDRRHRRGVGLTVAEALVEQVRALPGVRRVEYAGSLRRGRETIGDLDLLCAAEDGAGTVQRFTELEGMEEVLGAGETKGSCRFAYRPGRTIQVDLRVVDEDCFGAAWQYFTGSKEHNVRLRERAQQRGLTLNEYGLKEDRDDGAVIAADEESRIYAALDLPWIPPEWREDRFEFEASEIPGDLLSEADIISDLHMHTTASDGQATLQEMIDAATQRGLKLICITDHSASSVVANGLSAERLRAQITRVREVGKAAQIEVLAGSEVDIVADGLDYDDALLAELDFVVASLHVATEREAENTKRTLRAIEHPCVNLIAHPTGRLINRRAPFPINLDAVIEAAAETGTALEINASDHRLDLRDVDVRRAAQAGALISINTDSHAVEQFSQMRHGVATARRAGLLRGQVINTWGVDALRAFVTRKRDR